MNPIALLHYAALFLLLLNTATFAQSLVEPVYKVRSEKDVFYGTAKRFDGGTDSLKMNIYVPTNDDAVKRPLVVWVHGGGFIQGNRNDFNTLAETWAKRGYTAVTISYRLGIVGSLLDPPFAYDEAEAIRACYRGIQDVRGGLRFLVKNAAVYGIDTARCVIGGASAGSIIALHAAYFDAQDPIPPAAGKVSDAVRLTGTYPRPALGTPDGDLHLDVATPSVKVVLNIFGALFDLSYLGGSSFIPLFSYHQIDDPVVPCGTNRAYHAIGVVSSNYPYVHGTCSIKQELEKRGVAANLFGAILHPGAAHEVHDPSGVDRAAATFAAVWMLAPTHVNEESASDVMSGLWNIVSLDGRTAGRDLDLRQDVALTDGVYAATQGGRRHLVCVTNGRVAVAR